MVEKKQRRLTAKTKFEIHLITRDENAPIGEILREYGLHLSDLKEIKELARKERALTEMSVGYLLLKKRQIGFSGRFKHIQVFGETRTQLLEIIDVAKRAGLPLTRICLILKIERKRVHRWRKASCNSRKPYFRTSKPYNALLENEQELVAELVASKSMLIQAAEN